MLSADDELLDRFLCFGMRDVRMTDRPMRGMRDYIVRVVLRTLAGDVPQIVYTIDLGKLADEDEEDIHALCDAVYDFIFLDTEFTPDDGEWNEGLAADKNVSKQGELLKWVCESCCEGSTRVPLAGDSRRRKGG